MAIGSGVLISAVAFYLMDEASAKGGFGSTAGFLGGALVYTVANITVSRRGARRSDMGEAMDRQPVNRNCRFSRLHVVGLWFAFTCVTPPSAAFAQSTSTNPAAEQGVPGAPDPTAPHEGTATLAVVQERKEPRAVDLSVLYIGESWRNAGGGIRRGERYLDNLDITLMVDAERAFGWHGATLFVYGLYNNGHAFSGDLVGDAQTVSNIETGIRAARLYQAWIEQRLAGDRASIKFGLYDLNSEFDTTNVGSLSLLSSHGIGPEFGQSGRNGPSIFPYTSLAIRGEYKLTDRLTARAAMLDGVPDEPDHPKRTSIRLSRRDGVLGVVEVDYVGAPANVTIGYWRYSSRFPPWSATGSDQSRRGNQGGYAVIERRVTRPFGDLPDDKRGLAAFVQAGIAAPRFNRIDRYVGGGLVYTGVIASGEDRVGLTFAHAAFSDGYRRLQAASGVRVGPAENVIELTYRRAVTHFLTVQPDVQYVIHPSGERTLHNALALGLRFELGV